MNNQKPRVDIFSQDITVDELQVSQRCAGGHISSKYIAFGELYVSSESMGGQVFLE